MADLLLEHLIKQDKFSLHDIALDFFEADYAYDYQFLSKKNLGDLSEGNNSVERYASVLPALPNYLYLGEGDTPLIRSKKYRNLFIKDEGKNPSGSFKDRESAIIFPLLSQLGVNEASIVSSGNAALSASLYGKIYNIKVTSFVPVGTSKSKTSLIQVYGGKVNTEGTDYEDCYRSLLQNKEIVNITAGQCPARDLGDKLISYELVAEGCCPDYIFIPSANGSLLFSIYLGFWELMRAGRVKKLPKLVAVQVQSADPIIQAFLKNKQILALDNIEDSRAEGLIAMESYCSPKAVMALKETNGFGLSVQEMELNNAMRYAVREEGIIPEWTSAAGFAAIEKAYSQSIINENEIVVLINTGSGMKEISNIAEALT